MKYRLNGQITVSCYCEVDANSEQEAKEIADGLPPALHFNGSGTEPNENWLIEEPDGTPTGIRIEVAD